MKSPSKIWLAILLLTVLGACTTTNSNKLELSNATILVSPEIEIPLYETVGTVIQEEIENRTELKLKQQNKWSGKTFIALAISSQNVLFGETVPTSGSKDAPELKNEGYRLFHEKNGGKNILWIIGKDGRSLLFGIGHLLRLAEVREGGIFVESEIDISTSPEYPIRGHQFGYRNTANSWDAWTVEQFDQHFREQVLFGANCFENIPFQEGAPSVHMKLPREEMNIHLSNICNKYDADYWVWTPATFDLKDKKQRQAELEKHEAFYKVCPRLDGIFFPGGDPGHNHPKDVLPFLEDLTKILHKYHPEAGMWISLQGFNREKAAYFFNYVNEKQPDWLKGVVNGPSSPPMHLERELLPEKYMLRSYADITHTVRCQYPTKNWDQAFALTLGRECTNPQPVYYAQIHGKYAPFTDGFISYSDGCHDDVNKIIWSQRGWDPDKNVTEILKEYAKFFFSPDVKDKAASGILGLEQNWKGSIIDNGSIETTLAFWKDLEADHPELSDNWRWQMLVLRAYDDAYVRRRKINETELEKEANQMLRQVEKVGPEAAMSKALEIVNLADTKPIEREMRQKIEDYCQDLFETIGLQTSVEKYQASSSQRGCILDFVDYPLNNRWWLADQFEIIRSLSSEEAQSERILAIANWEKPGKGSYYDDVSNIANSPHVTTTVYDAVDFGWWDDGYCRWRLSSQVYQNDLILEYEDLDPNARYLVRVSGYGEALIRIDGQRLEPLVYDKELEGFKEFIVPRNVVGDGKITITFDRPEESHLRWKFYSRISDVWLIKR